MLLHYSLANPAKKKKPVSKKYTDHVVVKGGHVNLCNLSVAIKGRATRTQRKNCGAAIYCIGEGGSGFLFPSIERGSYEKCVAIYM